MDYLVIALALIALVLAVGFLVAGFRRRGTDVAERPGRTDDSSAGTGTATAGESPEGGVATAEPTGTPTAGPAPAEPTTGVAEPEPAPAVERPEPARGRMVRLRSRLARSKSAFGQSLLTLLSRDRVDEETWEEIEEALLTADVGVAPTQELIERLRTRVRVENTASAEEVRAILREELLTLVGPDTDRSLNVARHEGLPAVVLVVGVNGTGKTTTVGKLARVLVAEDKDVVLGAADTFRAAAVDQLATWGDRVGVPTIRGAEGSDPASVAFEAVKSGAEAEADVVIVDTAGRLHTKTGLMDELGKVKRVIEKQAPVSEVLLVIDATTGQNGLTQARVFAEVVDVTGIVLTKLDSTAKGGIIIAVQRELGVPVKLVGLGEGADDLAPFDPEAFVDALLAD